MAISNNQVPQLRFPEFTEEWEEKKLEEVAEVNPKNKQLPASFIYIDLESVDNGTLSKEEEINLVNAPSRAQRLLENNDILYQTVRPYQKNNLFFNKGEGYVASTGYAQIRTQNDPKYIYQYLHTEKFVNKVMLRCTGTSYPAINSTDLETIRISLPSFPEQQKIAAFLTAVDDKIQQLSQKKSLLEQYKKGAMQQIFSQEICFKDDNGQDFMDWEEKQFGEVFERITRKNKENNTNVLTISAQHGLVSQTDFFNKSVAAENVTGYYLLEKGDFAYNKSYSNEYPMGAIKRLTIYEKGVVSTFTLPN